MENDRVENDVLSRARDAGYAAVGFGVLAYQRDPVAALKVAYRALKSGGLMGAREPQKEGDWIGGPYREALMVFNQLVIEDAFKSVGRRPRDRATPGNPAHRRGVRACAGDPPATRRRCPTSR